MAFCAFDDGAALFDSTPVENMFITEYMLRAPGDFVKVYLYALMLCYHPSQRMSVASMAKDLDMEEEAVMRAFKYWARDGLVRQVGDNPVCFVLANVKQLTLSHAESPSAKLYDRNFTSEIDRILGRTLNPQEYQTIYDWVDVLEMPEEVVLMLLQIEMENSGGRVSIARADKKALEWAHSGVKSVEDVEKVMVIGRKQEQELRRLLSRLGQRRNPSDDEKAMYRKWVEEWGFTAEAVQEACRETTKGSPTMGYLDGILLRYHQMGLHDASALRTGVGEEKTQRGFAGKVLAGLGRVGVVPTAEDLAAIENWKREGMSEEMILLAVGNAHKRGGGMEDVENWLSYWRTKGLNTPEAIRADAARVRTLNAQLREIYEAAGVEKRPSAPDRDLLCRWAGDMGMDSALILLAAGYARGASAPIMTMNRILADWQKAGIRTAEAAQQEHASHVRGAQIRVPSADKQDVLQRHTAEERRASYTAAMVNFDEEDDG